MSRRVGTPVEMLQIGRYGSLDHSRGSGMLICHVDAWRQSALRSGCGSVDCVGCRVLAGMVLAVVVVAFEVVSLQRGQVDVLAVAGHTHIARDSVTPSAVTTPAPPPPASPGAPPARILTVPRYQQAYEPSREHASLRTAPAHESISTTDAIIINIIGIDTRSATFDNGAMHWGDPFVTFVGDPNGSETGVTGYGTYYPTIARAAVTLGGQVLSAGEGIAPAGVY